MTPVDRRREFAWNEYAFQKTKIRRMPRPIIDVHRLIPQSGRSSAARRQPWSKNDVGAFLVHQARNVLESSNGPAFGLEDPPFVPQHGQARADSCEGAEFTNPAITIGLRNCT